MTLTDSATISYESRESSAVTAADERIPVTRLPKLLWASAALLSMNLIIGAGMSATSNIELDMYGSEVRASSAALKPSPFTEVVDTTKRKVQVAAKLTPVVFESLPIEAQVAGFDAGSLSLDIPRASKASYQLDLPVRTQNAIYELPRASATERDIKFRVIN
jgi:hypothetical protein